MKINLVRKKIGNGFINICQSQKIVWGFSEKNVDPTQLSDFIKPAKIFQLKQIHSAIVLPVEQINDGTEGDGWVMRRKNLLAIIRTADCLPLFFWNRDLTVAGIIHIGWRGLQSRIDLSLARELSKRNIKPEDTFFFSGPAIESKCYPVDPAVYDQFNQFPFQKNIFARAGNTKKWFLNIPLGVEMVLEQQGFPSQNIHHSGLCTFCLAGRFPSHRREGNLSSRIYNFILLN